MIKRLTMWHARRGGLARRGRPSLAEWSGAARDGGTGNAALHAEPLCAGAGRYRTPYAGLGELWFDSMEVAVAAQATQQWRVVVDDAATFMDLDRLTIVWAEERTAP